MRSQGPRAFGAFPVTAPEPVETPRWTDEELLGKAASALHVALGYATHTIHSSESVEDAEIDGCYVVLEALVGRTNP